MIILLETKDEAQELVKELSTVIGKDFRIGLTGDFVDEEKEIKRTSVLEFVFKSKTKEGKDKVGKEEILEKVADFMNNNYFQKHRIIWLDLIEDFGEDLIKNYLDGQTPAEGLMVYENIIESVWWASDNTEEELEEDTDEEETDIDEELEEDEDEEDYDSSMFLDDSDM